MSRKKDIDLDLTGFAELFMNDEGRAESRLPRIYDIPLSEIDDFPNHPFKVKMDEDMNQLVQSVKERGIITPVTLRQKEDGRYEIVSGHRRRKACELAGLERVPAEIKELSRDEAIILMVESNLQRSIILPSEKAFSYKMRLEAMKRQGQRTDLTSTPVVSKSRSNEELADLKTNASAGVKWVAGIGHPTFAWDEWHISADYSAVDAAITAAKAIDSNLYSNYAGVEKAIDAVDRSKSKAEQSAVDAMAKAIEDAIAALQYKDADYTKVDAAIAKANALNKNDYRDFSAVKAALDAVARDKNITEQAKVDAMAKAVEDAINALVRKSSGGGSSSPSYSVTIPNKTENGTVTVSPRSAEKGDTVTITAKPDSGYQLDDLTVTDKNGKELKLTDKGNGKYTFTMPASKVTVTPTFVKIAQQPTGKTFSDVAKSDWFADAVAYVTDKGLMNGTGRDTFSPSASTTRGMLMTVLARYAGEDTTGGSPWYQKGMEWAKANGVSDGTNPEVNITREQLVTMLYRYAGSPKANGSLDSFSDAASVSSYAVNAMQWAVANGIVNGSNGKLNPKNNATRAEVAAILMRFCEMSK